jgi:acetyl esterase/lipase
MKNFGYLFLFLFLIQLGSISCSSENDSNVVTDDNTPEIPLEAATFLNVSYGSNPQQLYDIYLPAGRTSEKTKVIILVHGGGWIEGDKSDMTSFIPLLQQQHPNHAIVNMNYVLATASTPAFPNQFLDIDRVINKITDEKDSLQLLPEFGLIGTSAGAHISLQYEFVYDTEDVVKMVGNIVGPTDFTDPFYADNPNFAFLLALLVDESAYPSGTDYAVAVSPALHVKPNSSPVILFYGNQDPLVPLTNGQRLRDALLDKMITHSFTTYEGGHGDDWSEADKADLQAKLNAFIEAHLPIED